ncbi:UNVERIFIED_CONTAM: hypothetical protein RMT77_003035 [Armadillidium vulgare]
MHVFGSICYAYSHEKKKLDARNKQGIFVGYDNESPTYLVYFPEQNNIKKVRCVKSTEKFGQEETPEFEYEYTRPRTQEYGSIEEKEKEEPNKKELGENEKHERYPKKQRNKPKYLEDYDDDTDKNLLNVYYSMDYCYRITCIPKSYEEAMASSDSHHWKKAIYEEIDSVVENHSNELTPLPEGRSVVGGRWVFAIKQGPNDEEKFKARCVAKGYSQVKEVDYQEIFHRQLE